MEHQLFCKEGQDQDFYDFYKGKSMEFLGGLGLPAEKLRFKDHEKLAHYAKAACDVEYQFNFGWGEINGVHNRTDFDLSRHQEFSGKNMEYTDPITNEKFIPYVVEASDLSPIWTPAPGKYPSAPPPPSGFFHRKTAAKESVFPDPPRP